MPEPDADLLAAIAAQQAALAAGHDRFTAVARLRDLHERAARVHLGAADGRLTAVARAAVEASLPLAAARGALAHLAEAERFQWEIGSWATGAGEGLASMREVRELQLAQAWVWSTCVDDAPDARDRALGLAHDVEHDPNDIAADLAPSIRGVRARLATI